MTKEEFKNLFLKLTEYTIPFGHEDKIQNLLPSGFKKDSVGNYYYQIGESKTLFTTHLDTYSQDYEKVNHVIDQTNPYIIRTDQTTILGGDNKLGCTILISMIKDNIPGTYYFFIGEEPILSGGLFGSSEALKSNPEFFKQFDRCIAFDRKEFGSIVVRQMGRMCCSSDFAKSIADEFDIRGIKWDSTKGFGYYTDTAVFMDIIPECTNISAGGFFEHFKKEWVDLNYTYQVYLAAKEVDWEKLPVKRELETRFSKEESKIDKYIGFNNSRISSEIDELMKMIDLSKTRDISKEGVRHLTYSRWLQDFDLDIYLKSGKIIVNDETMDLNKFKSYLVSEFKDDIFDEIKYNKEIKNYKMVQKIIKTFNLKASSSR
jgi:hypothetical protein